MTLDQFFDELAKKKETHHWTTGMGSGALIRGQRKGDLKVCCPITAVHGIVCAPHFAEDCARELGLRKSTSDRIILAADSPLEEPQLRKRILSTLGLS